MISSNSSSVVSQLPPSGRDGSSGNKPGNLSVNGENRSVSQIQQQEGIPNPLKDLALTVYYVALGVIAIGAFSAALICPLAGFVAVPIAKLLVTGLVAHFALCHGGPSISTPPGQIFASLFGDNNKAANTPTPTPITPTPTSTTPPPKPPRLPAAQRRPLSLAPTSTPTPVLTSASSAPAVTSVIDSSLHPSLIINPPSPSKPASAPASSPTSATLTSTSTPTTPSSKPVHLRKPRRELKGTDMKEKVVVFDDKTEGTSTPASKLFYPESEWEARLLAADARIQRNNAKAKIQRAAAIAKPPAPTATPIPASTPAPVVTSTPSPTTPPTSTSKPSEEQKQSWVYRWLNFRPEQVTTTLSPVDVDKEEREIMEKTKEKGVIDKGISFVKKELSDVFVGEEGRRLLDDEDDDEFNIEMDPISDDEFGSFVEDYIDDENHDWSPPKREPPLYF